MAMDPLRTFISLLEDARSKIDSIVKTGAKQITGTLPTLPFPAEVKVPTLPSVEEIIKLPTLPELPELPGLPEILGAKAAGEGEVPPPPTRKFLGKGPGEVPATANPTWLAPGERPPKRTFL